MQWILQQDEPEDFVNATGAQYSVREFIHWAASELGLTLEFEGYGVEEIARVSALEGHLAPALKVGDIVMRITPRYFRPRSGNVVRRPDRAKNKLGWMQITAREMCAEMVAEDHAVGAPLCKEHGLELPVSVGIAPIRCRKTCLGGWP